MKKNIMKEYRNDKGQYHRTDGPAVIYPNGSKEWWIDNKLHRIDGPAVIYPNGDMVWYKNGVLHRKDGPAIKYVNGYKGWYVEGKYYTKQKFNDYKLKLKLIPSKMWII